MESTLRRNFSFPEGWGILIGVPALVLLAYIYPLIPGFSTLPLCGVRHFLGVDCPGCGLTSSFAALAHGHIRMSIDCHPLGIVIMLWLIYMFGRSACALLCGRMPRPLLMQGQRDFIMYAFLVALIGRWVFKLLLRHLTAS